MHIIYAILVLFNICMIFIDKSNLPNYKNAEIISGHSGWSLICFSLISIIITVFHESGHYLAAAELNIPVKIKLSLRLIFLVIETDINSIWGVTNKKRYICYLAGFYMENIILMISFLVKAFSFSNSLTINICNAIILTVFLNFVWQLMIFLRTDFYFILLNYLNISALHFTAMQLIKNPRKKIENKFNIKVYVYLCIYVIGSIASVVYFINEVFIYSNLIEISVKSFELNFENICFYIIMFLNVGMWGKGAYNRYTDYKYEKNNKVEA